MSYGAKKSWNVMIQSRNLLLQTLILVVIFTAPCLTLFRMGLFGTAHGWGEWAKRFSFPKICHTYPKMMKTDALPKEDPEIYKF